MRVAGSEAAPGRGGSTVLCRACGWRLAQEPQSEAGLLEQEAEACLLVEVGGSRGAEAEIRALSKSEALYPENCAAKDVLNGHQDKYVGKSRWTEELDKVRSGSMC